MRAIISDRDRPWYPACRPFLAAPVNPVALRRFQLEARARHGLFPCEAEVFYLLCCGHTGDGELARCRRCTVATIKNTKTRAFGRLDLWGIGATLEALLLLWPLYRAAHLGLGGPVIVEGEDATGLGEARTQDAGAGAAVHRGGAGALPGIWASADSGADGRD